MGNNKEDDGENQAALDLFLKIGLDERTARNTLANAKVTASLTAVISEVRAPSCSFRVLSFLGV